MSIVIKNLFKSFEKIDVIRDFSMEFEKDKIHCIVGPSGCGKTTLINILTSILQKDSGDIEGIYDKNYSYVFQEDRLLPWRTVKGNILFVLEDRYSKDEANSLAERYIELVELNRFKDSYPKELSGGMKQRVSIARALAYRGDIFIMDEPFKGLDYKIKKSLMDYILSSWNNKGRYFIFVTHDMTEAVYMADYIHKMQGPPLQYVETIKVDKEYRKKYFSREMDMSL